MHRNQRYGVFVAARAQSEADQPTTTIERETLRDLLDMTVEPPPPAPQRVHTVPRDRVRRRDEFADDDLDAQLSPLVVIGVFGLLLVVFIAVSHLH